MVTHTLVMRINGCVVEPWSGDAEPLADGLGTTSEDSEPFGGSAESGGFIAISRWLSAATPPDHHAERSRIPEGCQRLWHDETSRVSPAALRSLRDRMMRGTAFRGCRSCLAQPPANGWHPSGMAGVTGENAAGAADGPKGFETICRRMVGFSGIRSKSA